MASVLIVDDSVVAVKMLREMILSLGYAVVGEANSGIRAIEEYAALQPDIVTMDLAMDGMNGIETITRMIDRFPVARIIVVSARQDNQAIFQALERGARHFMIKPVTAEKLAVVFDNVLNQSFDWQQHRKLIRKMKIAKGLLCEDELESIKKRQKFARVLIVDDSAVARKSLKEMLEALGHMVAGEAANGTQAFVEYTKLKPDIVTMDLMMEGLGGAETTSKIIAAYPEAKIVVISAMEDRQTIFDALERGARHFIIKPISEDKIKKVITSVLSQDCDIKSHMRRVQLLKGEEECLFPESKHLQPYAISFQGTDIVQALINETISLNSCQTLFQELEEYVTKSPKLLFDFGEIVVMDAALLTEFNRFIKKISHQGGMVRALSNSKKFVDGVAGLQQDDMPNLLASVLRYLPI